MARGVMVLVQYRAFDEAGNSHMVPSQGHGPFDTREGATEYLNNLRLPNPEYCLILPLTEPS